MVLDSFEPSSAWYLYNPYGIHGIGHAARVLVLVNQIGNFMIEQGVSLDKEVTLWAAVLHDVRRIDDGQDPLHGQRAAEWVRKSYAHGFFTTLNNHQLQQVIYCCTWHVPDDALIPQITPELICLKDADGLDRVRLNDFNPSFLRTSYARTLINRLNRK